MFFDQLGLVSSEEHIPQVDENTEKAKWLLVALESAVTRPRQARYQAALRPDWKCLPIIQRAKLRAAKHECRPPGVSRETYL